MRSGAASKYRNSAGHNQPSIPNSRLITHFVRSFGETAFAWLASRSCERSERLAKVGGGRGIRTPGAVSRTAVFKTACFNHSHIPPGTIGYCVIGYWLLH